jgi:hypothetical protein
MKRRYLPTFPYTENPVLHIYAGLLCLYMAQPSQPAEGISEGETFLSNASHSYLYKQCIDTYNPALLRDAQLHLERAKSIDSENEIAEVFLLKVINHLATFPLYDANSSSSRSLSSAHFVLATPENTSLMRTRQSRMIMTDNARDYGNPCLKI